MIKIVAKMEVNLVKNLGVFVPNIDSTPENISTNPPPRPDWIRTTKINNKQAII